VIHQLPHLYKNSPRSEHIASIFLSSGQWY